MRGEDHYNASVLEEDVIRIWRDVHFLGFTRREAAKMNGASYDTVKHICRRNSWKHLDLPTPTEEDIAYRTLLKRTRFKQKKEKTE